MTSAVRTAAARRRTREIAAVRDEILDAAARAFCRAGYSAATMAAIAKEAGFAASALYTYFQSKEEIHDALVESVRAEFYASLDAPLPRGLTLTQRLELLLSRQLAAVERRRHAYQVFYALAPAAAFIGRGARPRGAQVGLLAWAERLAEWMREGLPPKETGRAEELAWLYIGITWAFKRRWLLKDSDRNLTAEAPCILRLFLHGADGAECVR